MEEGGSMSDEQETGVITDLEEVFLSREFGRAPARRIAVGGAEAPLDDRLARAGAARGDTAHLRALPSLEPHFAAAAAAADGVAAAAVPRGNLQHRAIAAVSGVAAAALVVAGLASGGGHPGGHQLVSAQGKGTSTGSPQSSVGPTSPSSSSPIQGSSAPIVGAGGTSGAPTFATVAAVTRTGSPPPVTVEVPAGTSVTVVTTPPASGTSTTTGTSTSTGGGSGTGTGTGTGTGGSPTPPTTSGSDPLAPVVVTVGNTVTTVGNTATSTATQLTSSVPSLSPLASMLAGTGVTAAVVGQSINSATT
jgi:hypothetical protein